MFIGEYNCKLDSKGRITLPSKFREKLSKTFVVNRGLEHCIELYPISAWEKTMEKLEKLDTTKINNRKYIRFITSAAEEIECDSQGRMKIPNALIEYSKLSKDVVVTGNMSKIEIWSKENWTSYIEDAASNIEDIANSIEF